MDTSTTTCSYTNPVQPDGSTAVNGSSFAFSSSTCVTSSTLGTSAITPLITQDSGSIVFGLSLILFVLSFAVLGLIFGTSKTSFFS